MSNDVQIIETQNGIDIQIKGDVKKEDVEQLTQACSEGTCDCDCSPDMFSKITSIQTVGKDGDVSILLTGNNLKANEISDCMSGCDCGF